MYYTHKFERLNKNMHVTGFLLMAVLITIISLMITGCSNSKELLPVKKKTVGKDVTEDNFKEFYYTYSKTVNPPKFQRYRFYIEDGKPMFYHEKREGNKVFLTEEDITVYGTMELSDDEWNTFWDYINNGTVKNREENNTSGGSGPWLYLYWDGDNDKCQQFSFSEPGIELGFEEFCIELKERQMKESGDDSSGLAVDGNSESTNSESSETGAVADVNDNEQDKSAGEDEEYGAVFPVRKNRVEVSNTLEFLNAIADDTEIVMSEGEYNLTLDMQIEGEEQFIKWGNEHDKVVLSMNLNDGFAVEIYCVNGLSIVAAEGANVSIVTEPRNVNVLLFSNCSDIFMSGITMGHTPDKGSCDGGVIKLSDCENTCLENMDLYGCGTYGIIYQDIDSLEVFDSIIRDCSLGIIDGSNGRNLSFVTCDMANNDGFVMLRMNTSDALFDDCYFFNNNLRRSFLPVENMENNIIFNECLFGDMESQSIDTIDYADNGCIQFRGCKYGDDEITEEW